jgi:hypothetical protein
MAEDYLTCYQEVLSGKELNKSNPFVKSEIDPEKLLSF